MGMNRSPITSHVLDTANGKPARGISVRLEHCPTAKQQSSATEQLMGWTVLATGYVPLSLLVVQIRGNVIWIIAMTSELCLFGFSVTDADGRCSQLLVPTTELEVKGIYRIIFFCGDYFQVRIPLTVELLNVTHLETGSVLFLPLCRGTFVTSCSIIPDYLPCRLCFKSAIQSNITIFHYC
jgi:5-hydroxyisourate hydrolase-like protein (transthyretin family)